MRARDVASDVKGPDPRRSPSAAERVPSLVREGADQYARANFWHAHEAWEQAWHALRAAQREADAEFLQGLILAAAAFENLRRGKPAGFRRQMAQALHQLRTRSGCGAALGVVDETVFVDALTDLYLDAARRTRLAGWDDLPRAPPRLLVTSNP